MWKFKTGLILHVVCIAACSGIPDVVVQDPLPDEVARDMVRDSVWVSEPLSARRFEDPAWPSPIQLVAPSRSGNPIDGSYGVYLFGSRPSGKNIDVILVGEAEEGECRTLFSMLGLSPSDLAFIEADGSDEYLLCGSSMVGVPKGVRSPLAGGYKYVEIINKGTDGEYKSFRIRYLK